MIQKAVFLNILLLILCHHLFAQLQTGYHYKIINSIHYKIYYNNGSALPTPSSDISKKISKRKLSANVVQQGSNLIIDFWSIIPKTDSYKRSTTIINSSDVIGKNNYYYIHIDDKTNLGQPTNYVSLSYATWEVGATTIPFKYRFGNKKDSIPNDASTSVNAGIYVGRKWGGTRFFQDKDRQTNSWAFTLGGFFAPTAIALSSDNTKKKVTTKSNELGISYGIAFLSSFRDINIGILGGIETPISGQSKYWIYKNRPWIGFGIGYKLGIFGGK